MEFDFFSGVQAELLNASPRNKGKIGEQLRFIFDKLIESSGATRAVEVGAYEASFAKRFKRRHPDSNVIAYEANPNVFEHFKKEVTRTGVDYRHRCVGPENSQIEIAIPRDFRGIRRPANNQMASLMSNLHADDVDKVQVDCVRLDDDVLPSPEDVIALWVDVEGATSQVFGAAKKTLERTAALLVEVESRPIWEGQWLAADVDAFLRSCGFVALARDTQRVHQFNFIYANPRLVDLKPYVRLVSRYLAGTHVFAS
ncbi:FkbM family methyltransferase [Henriciella sp. AS95]|uniref:FkbM family methyltransferase n=1 Tax=Henriciella sp. AS95 TaxID=3135782 RepID=UPI00316BF66E